MRVTKNPLYADAMAVTEKRAAGGLQWTDPRKDDALPDVYLAMGETAENVADHCGVSRADQDAFAVRNQNLAEAAGEFWQKDITPVTLPDGSPRTTVRERA